MEFFILQNRFIYCRCRIEKCYGNYDLKKGRLPSIFSNNSVLPTHYLMPLIANNFLAKMVRTPLCMSLHFCIYFYRCLVTQVISAQSVLATIMPPLEKPLLFMRGLALACQKTEKGNSVTNFEIQLCHLKNVRVPVTRSCTCFDNSDWQTTISIFFYKCKWNDKWFVKSSITWIIISCIPFFKVLSDLHKTYHFCNSWKTIWFLHVYWMYRYGFLFDFFFS